MTGVLLSTRQLFDVAKTKVYESLAKSMKCGGWQLCTCGILLSLSIEIVLLSNAKAICVISCRVVLQM